jgi:hypothetical protein
LLPEHAIEKLRAYIDLQAAPRALSDIRKDFKKSDAWSAAATIQAVEGALSARAAFRWPSGKTYKVWRIEPQAFVTERLLKAAGEVALAEPALLRRATAGKLANSKQAQEVFRKLVAEGALRRLPRVQGRGFVYAPSTGSHAYLASSAGDLGKFFERFRQAGATNAEILAFMATSLGEAAPAVVPSTAPQPRQLADELYRKLRELTRGEMIPLTVHRLRAEFLTVPKADFDRAALELAEKQRVYLTTHDHGWALPQEEREQLVNDGGGNLYVAIALRD